MTDAGTGSEPTGGETTTKLLRCHTCGACGNVRVCLGCHEVYYCNRVCLSSLLLHLVVFF